MSGTSRASSHGVLRREKRERESMQLKDAVLLVELLVLLRLKEDKEGRDPESFHFPLRVESPVVGKDD